MCFRAGAPHTPGENLSQQEVFLSLESHYEPEISTSPFMQLGIAFAALLLKQRRYTMKTMITLLFSILSLAVSAQNVTVTFQGSANRAKSYQVVIDGLSYYSANSVSANGRQITTIKNLSEGAHNLEVYTVSNRNSGYSDGSATQPATKPVYTKTFQLRQGYDMNITI